MRQPSAGTLGGGWGGPHILDRPHAKRYAARRAFLLSEAAAEKTQAPLMLAAAHLAGFRAAVAGRDFDRPFGAFARLVDGSGFAHDDAWARGYRRGSQALTEGRNHASDYAESYDSMRAAGTCGDWREAK